MCIYDDDSYDSYDDDDSYDTLSIHPLIYMLIMDMKINISIDTLCYSLRCCHYHAIIYSKSIHPSIHHHHHHCHDHHHYIITIYLSIIHPSIHHHQMSSIHVYSLSFYDAPNYEFVLAASLLGVVLEYTVRTMDDSHEDDDEEHDDGD
jgi:hypothetical protein